MKKKEHKRILSNCIEYYQSRDNNRINQLLTKIIDLKQEIVNKDFKLIENHEEIKELQLKLLSSKVV